MFLGTGFIILFIFFGTNAYWNRNQNENKLKNLANEINDSLNIEIRHAWNQLETYDKIGLERFNIDSTLPRSAKILMKNPLQPARYPYFDYAFWLDSTGLQPVSYTHLRAHETRHDIVC